MEARLVRVEGCPRAGCRGAIRNRPPSSSRLYMYIRSRFIYFGTMPRWVTTALALLMGFASWHLIFAGSRSPAPKSQVVFLPASSTTRPAATSSSLPRKSFQPSPPEQHHAKTCPRGCTLHGNCDEITGECACPFTHGGPACDEPRMPAWVPRGKSMRPRAILIEKKHYW